MLFSIELAPVVTSDLLPVLFDTLSLKRGIFDATKETSYSAMYGAISFCQTCALSDHPVNETSTI